MKPKGQRRLRDSRNNSFSIHEASSESDQNNSLEPSVVIEKSDEQLQRSILKKGAKRVKRNTKAPSNASGEVEKTQRKSVSFEIPANSSGEVVKPKRKSVSFEVPTTSETSPTANKRKRCSERIEKMANLLSGSKRKNVDNWLSAARSSPPSSPSASPMSLSPNQLSSKRRRKPNPELDTEMKVLMKAIYSGQQHGKSNTLNPMPKLSAATIRKIKMRFRRKNVFNEHDSEIAKYSKTEPLSFLASLSVSSQEYICHPDAQEYKINFLEKRDELAHRLYKFYNAEIFENKLPNEILINWSPKMRGSAGHCYSRIRYTLGGIVRSIRIQISSTIVDRAGRLRDTLVHEMCHGASWVIDGYNDHHGPNWRAWTKKVQERFPELPTIKPGHNYQVTAKYTYRCAVCFYSLNRQTRCIDLRKRCGLCMGPLQLLVNKKKKGTETPVFRTKAHVKKPPSGFSLFVKENYKSVKGSMPSDKKHGDVMKQLSEKFKLLKGKESQD